MVNHRTKEETQEEEEEEEEGPEATLGRSVLHGAAPTPYSNQFKRLPRSSMGRTGVESKNHTCGYATSLAPANTLDECVSLKHRRGHITHPPTQRTHHPTLITPPSHTPQSWTSDLLQDPGRPGSRQGTTEEPCGTRATAGETLHTPTHSRTRTHTHTHTMLKLLRQ